MTTSRLLHRVVYEDASRVALSLPFHPSLEQHFPGGRFPLLFDPSAEKRALLMGMFVLRPAQRQAFTAPLLSSSASSSGAHNALPSPAVFSAELDWAYNVDGLDGGKLIANGSALDAFRLGLQYGLCDAVIVGSHTVAKEGVPREGREGYLWQPYNPLSWPHVRSADPNIAEKVAATRDLWQRAPYNVLSRRTHPATIVFSLSGRVCAGERDFLEASVFHTAHPHSGDPIECYIATSEAGAQRVRERAARLSFSAERIEEMLIVLPPPPSSQSAHIANTQALNEEVDITQLPHILFTRYDMRVVQHDGGRRLLKEFLNLGVITQFHMTLGRHTTVRDVLSAHTDIPMDVRERYMKEFDQRVAYFFDKREPRTEEESDAHACDNDKKCVSHGLSRDLQIVSVCEDAKDEVALYVFDCRPRVRISDW